MNSGDIIASRYVLERPLAKGGMGTVWVARHLELDVRVALKVMAPEYLDTPLARERFQREAKACAQIQSPHVVAVHDYGVMDGAPFLVMALLEGEDLQARLARENRLSPAAAVGVLIPVCKGLRRAHELGIIHRDIKPSNIFLARQGEDEVVKLLDFGVARLSDDLSGQTTRTGTLLGSPFYMSPEQARGRRVDHRSDLWSVAVVLYQCLTGRLPFVSQTLGDLLVEVCTEPIPLPTTIAPDLPTAVDPFFQRALARNPDERFQSAGDLAEALAVLAIVSPNDEFVRPSTVLRGPMATEPSAPPSPPPALSPTVPGMTRTIDVSRPRAAKLALGILAPVVIGLGALAAHRSSKTSNTDLPLGSTVAAPADPSSPPSFAMPAPTLSSSSTAAALADPTPSPSASSAARPPDTPQARSPNQARRPPPKDLSRSPPAPTRDPTFGF